ncbi:hypothetical protein [Cyanobium sp. ATX 6F1]|uniref:hypothetical protein n=1 Tax=unclassified Cyanobium TaxID=2627006 RepID=UPI0020CD203D|nr:hypothetical protein [Cyanobium sp. ATX 6F1]MCP9915647.1 hypothetical protein [Cyanobium sp. ATX 6F1]
MGATGGILALLAIAPNATAQQVPQAPQGEAAPAAAVTAPAPASTWAGSVELYGFAPLRTTGSTTVKGITADLDLSLDQVLRPLTGIAAIRGSVEYNRLGFLTDLSYVSLKGAEGRTIPGREFEKAFAGREFTRGGVTVGVSGPSLKASSSESSVAASVGNIQGIYDFALRYRFGDRETATAKAGSFAIIPYAGVRLVDMRFNLGFERETPTRTLSVQGPSVTATVQGPNQSVSATRPGGTATFERPSRTIVRTGEFGGTVVQPLIGTQAMVFLSPRLRLFARGDIGGFGVNNADDYSWNTQVGVGYAIGNSTQLNLSWRYMHLGGTNGATPENAYNIDQNGIEAGVKFFF